MNFLLKKNFVSQNFFKEFSKIPKILRSEIFLFKIEYQYNIKYGELQNSL